MATTTKPKSILKKPSYPATGTSKEVRDREIALYHANLIQQRKDIEYEILLSTETLIDFPLVTAPYDASNPSPSDANAFKNLLRPFQPSDYDALIVERNINEHCGYTLCPNKRLKESGGGKYRILGMSGKAKDFRVVEKEELEKWCSEACARRALYVRVQLSENPAWERESLQNIDLLDEPKSGERAVLDGIQKLHLGGNEELGDEQDAVDLALERGDKGRAAKDGLVDVTIQEKRIKRPAEAPSLETAELSGQLDNMHLTLEGHTPSFGKDNNGVENDEDEDQDMDWKL
jgi:RNA polymerase II-associated protein 2